MWSPAGQFMLGKAASPFKLPCAHAQVDLTHLVIQNNKPNCVDDGNRNVGVVTYTNFCNSDLKKALKKAATCISELCDGRFQQVEHGYMVIVVDPELNPNTATYRLPFLVAEVIY